MNATAAHDERERSKSVNTDLSAERERDLDRALIYILNARLAEVEASNAQMRALLGLDPPPPAIGADWRSIKQAAGATGFSETTIRKRIARGEIEAIKVGGHVLIAAASLRRRGEKAR
jgi:excisionase family DNA binding protein